MRFGMVCLQWLLAFPLTAFAADVLVDPKGRAVDLGPDVKLMVELRHAMFWVHGVGVDGTGRAEDLSYAIVEAGGAKILLDVSRSKAAEQALVKHAFFSHGDFRVSVLSLTGELIFRRQAISRQGAVLAAGLIPVILVTSAKAELIQPDGISYLTAHGDPFQSAPIYCEVQGAGAKASKLSLSDQQGEFFAAGSNFA